MITAGTMASAEARPDPSVGGKYRELITTLHVPADVHTYGAFHDHGYYEATRYVGKLVPAGYWVYVAPTWYVWKRKDLTAAGLTVMVRTVKLAKRSVTFRFEHKPKNKAWAKTNLDALVRGIRELERWSGVPFPGSNPYRIYEGAQKGLLGFASPRSMYLASPPASKVWTLMHEMIHIWNAGVRPKWIGEGQANFISFWLMRRLKIPFAKGNTFQAWIAHWKPHQGTKRDHPLYDRGADNYTKVRQGKGMELWSILYQRVGPSFVRWVFEQGIKAHTVTVAQILDRLRKVHGVSKPEQLLSGWVTRGRYYVKSHKLQRPAYRLP
jgi:hypothetical protein